MTVIEIAWGVLALLASVFGFYFKRLYAAVDKNTADIKDVQQEVTEHRIHDAANYPSRKELDDKLTELKADIRGMIGPIHTHLQNLEYYLRNDKKPPL